MHKFEKDTDHLMSNLPKVGYIYLTITYLPDWPSAKREKNAPESASDR